MAEIISRSQEIIDRLKKDGKVTRLQLTPEEMTEMNEYMGVVKRDFRMKSAKSELEASGVIICVRKQF